MYAPYNILLDIAILISIWFGFDFNNHSGLNIAVFWVAIGNAIVNIVLSAFLIYGYFKRNPGFYLPYIMNNAIIIIVLWFFMAAWFWQMKEERTGTLFPIPMPIQLLEEFFHGELPENLFGLALIVLPLFVFLSYPYPIYWSAYKSLNNDLQKRLGSINSTRQQGQQSIPQPTTLDFATVGLASHAELPCTSPIGQLAGTNTSAEQASLHESLADYKVI